MGYPLFIAGKHPLSALSPDGGPFGARVGGCRVWSFQLDLQVRVGNLIVGEPIGDRGSSRWFTADDPVRQVLYDYFAWATNGAMARYHDSADDVPDGLEIPKWSWDGHRPDT